MIGEPRTEPEEELPVLTAGCGCEVYAGREALPGVADGCVWMDDPQTGKYRSFCVECFVDEMTKFLRRHPYEAARELGLEYREFPDAGAVRPGGGD